MVALTFYLAIVLSLTVVQMLRIVPAAEGNPSFFKFSSNTHEIDRAKIESRVAKEKGIVVVFLESLCDDPVVIAANIALKVSSGDPDYKDMSREKAEQDFIHRIKEYEKVYETITEPHLSYLQIKNVGSEVTLSRINGYLQSRIAFYLMNLHIKPRSIFFSRVSAFLSQMKHSIFLS